MDGVMQFALAKLAHVYSGRGNIVSAFVWWMFFFFFIRVSLGSVEISYGA